MKLSYRLVMAAAMAMGLAVLSGCGGSASNLRCAYKVGDTETVSYSMTNEYKTWVKMPDKEPTKPDARMTAKDLVMIRTVKEVAADGTALMEVTIVSAKLSIDTDVRDKPSHKEYVSTESEQRSDWPNEPKLAGSSYSIRIAPDTTVVEFVGLDDLRAALRDQLKLKEGDELTGVAASLLDENELRSLHEREFVKFAPAKLASNKPYSVDLPLPDSMIKAKAVRKVFTPVVTDGQVTVTSTVEPLYTLPEGMAEPVEPNNFGQSLIKDKSDMQELTLVNDGQFDLAQGKLKSETIKLDCLLILDGDKLGFGSPNQKQAPKGAGGEMFTTINSKVSFVVE